MQDKKVRFSAEENIRPVLRGLSEESSKLGRKLIEDARAYTTSSKETLKYIEEQIRAKERLIALESKGARVELERAYGRGDIKKAEYSREKTEIGITDKYSQQQVGLLRELINTIKSESQKEIREDRKGVEASIKASKTVEQLSPKGDPEKILKETIQRAELGDIKTTEREEKEKFRYGKVLERGSNALGGVAGSRNQFYMLAATLAMIPVIGQGASAIANKGFSSAERYQEGLGGMSQLTGLSQSNFYGAGGDLTNIGYSKAPFLELQRRTAIARGGVGASVGAARDVAYLERGTGFGADIFLEQEQLSRAGGLGARAGTQRLVRGLQGVGGIKGQDMSLLGEYLPILVNLQREQVKLTGETNNEIATKLVTGIASLDESFKNPDVLRNVMPSIMGGLTSATSPQAEALQFRVLSRLSGNRGKSFTQLQEERERPTLEYFQSTVGELRGMSPNQEALIQNIKGFFGLQGKTGIARKIAEGTFDTGTYTDEAGIIDLKTRAGKEFATGELKAGTALFTEKFETVGQGLIDAIQKLAGITEKSVEGLQGLEKNQTASQKALTESAEALSKSSNSFDKFLSVLIRTQPAGYGAR
jgi:hypothetical protein